MAFSYLTSVSAGSTNSNNVTSGAIDTSGAKIIVVGVSRGTLGTVGAPTDNQGNTYTLAVNTNVAARNSLLFYCINPTTNASHTFSYSDTSSFPAIYAAAFSGEADSLDATNSNTTSGSTIQPGSVSPAGDNELFVTVVAENSGSVLTVSIDSSFTIVQELCSTVSADYRGGAIAYKIQTTGSAENPTWSGFSGAATAATIANFTISGSSSVNSGFFQFM